MEDFRRQSTIAQIDGFMKMIDEEKKPFRKKLFRKKLFRRKKFTGENCVELYRKIQEGVQKVSRQCGSDDEARGLLLAIVRERAEQAGASFAYANGNIPTEIALFGIVVMMVLDMLDAIEAVLFSVFALFLISILFILLLLPTLTDSYSDAPYYRFVEEAIQNAPPARSRPQNRQKRQSQNQNKHRIKGIDRNEA